MKKSLLIICCLSFALYNYAQTDSLKKAPWFVEKFSIGAGALFANNNTAVRLGSSSGGIGDNLDFENDLGFKKESSSFLGNVQWRVTRRSRFDLSYYSLNRSASKTIQKSFTFGDNTYNINTTINSFFNNTIFRFSWGYALIAKPKGELGLLIGVHSLTSSIGIGLSTGGAKQENIKFTAPLPDLGIWGGYAFSDRWAFNGEFSYLSLKSGNIGGQILSYNFLVNFKAAKQLDLSAGYTGFDFKVEAKKDNKDAYIKWGYNGPSIKAAYSFGKKKWSH